MYSRILMIYFRYTLPMLLMYFGDYGRCVKKKNGKRAPERSSKRDK
jgi:hypothetical protein